MADLEFTATTDFNADGEFSECEVDMSWATLQVKALVEASGNVVSIGGNTITITDDASFLTAVKAQHALNVGGTVAVDGCQEVSSLPLGISLVPSIVGLDNVLGYWRLNESAINLVFDSSENGQHGSTDTLKWLSLDKASVAEKHGMKCLPWLPVDIPDSGGNLFKGNFTFHVKMFIKDKPRIRIYKKGTNLDDGNQQIDFKGDKIYIGWGAGNNYTFSVDTTEWANKTVDFWLVVDGEKLSPYVMVDGGAVVDLSVLQNGNRWQRTISGGFTTNNDPLRMKGMNVGDVTTDVKATYVREIYVMNRIFSMADMQEHYHHPAQFRFLLDGTDVVETGELVEQDTEYKVALPATGTINSGENIGNVGITAINNKKCTRLTWNQFFEFDSFDFTEDFSLSFWFNSNKTYHKPLQTSDGKFYIEINANNLVVRLDNGTDRKTWMTPESGILTTARKGKDFLNNWHHFTLVQSYGVLELYLNGTNLQLRERLHAYWGAALAEPHGTMTSGMNAVTLKLGSTNGQAKVHDFSLIKGGVVRVDDARTSSWVEPDQHNIDQLYAGTYWD